MQSLKFTVKYRVPCYIIYQALTDSSIIDKYTQSKNSYDNKVGGDFSLYDGSIVGTIVELETNKRIAQTWKFKNWEKGADLKITFDEAKGNECVLTIDLKNIANRDIFNQTIELEPIKEGFMSQIFDNISKFLGYPQNKDSDSGEESD